ncbi:MAG: hypothetical protein FWG71_02610 [Synergistaceae bacterium]|nr:hypothetical protein [Synergistaceae bacterium]
MEHITTYMGKDFTLLVPSVNQIHIEDIAHALSLMCRANRHFIRFYSVAQHSINCANEAKARGLSERVQIACLLHNASEAYLPDITRLVKAHLSKYLEIEKRLQDTIYNKFLGSPLSENEAVHVDQIDHDVLVCEFNALMTKKVFDDCPIIIGKLSFEFCGFAEIEKEFLEIFRGIKTLSPSKHKSLKAQIADIENGLRYKVDVLDYVKQHRVTEMLAEKLYIKRLSAQVDVAIHAYGILVALSKILEDDEVIEHLSLGAGTKPGKTYDVVTSKRIAEFKFAEWDRGSNTIRQNGIFKDFLELAINTKGCGKTKYIYCLSADDIIKFLSSSERNLGSVLSRNMMDKKYPKYQERYKTVKAFYQEFKNEVEIVELGDYIEPKE